MVNDNPEVLTVISVNTWSEEEQLKSRNADISGSPMTMTEALNLGVVKPHYIVVIRGSGAVIHGMVEQIYNACDCAFYRTGVPSNKETETHDHIDVEITFPKDELDIVIQHCLHWGFDIIPEHLTKEN